MFEFLKAVDYIHSRGIMHKDLKPLNIIVDQANRKLRVIDFGISEFYFPGKSYSLIIGSRFYVAPETYLGLYKYDYSIDTWSIGVVFA